MIGLIQCGAKKYSSDQRGSHQVQLHGHTNCQKNSIYNFLHINRFEINIFLFNTINCTYRGSIRYTHPNRKLSCQAHV